MQKAVSHPTDHPGALSPSAARALVFQSLTSSIRRLVATLGERRRLRRAERDLETLDDHMLRDIGIGRSEIRRAVRSGRGFSLLG
jgi:uncharacterized protein YjiS (DUF1127 family)